MIPADLLDQLREKDPEAHARYWRLRSASCGMPSDTEAMAIIEDMCMQADLQSAIRARGWHLYQIRNDDLPGLPCFADIIILGHGKEHDIHNEGEGSTESEALLRAYLAAIHEAE